MIRSPFYSSFRGIWRNGIDDTCVHRRLLTKNLSHKKIPKKAYFSLSNQGDGGNHSFTSSLMDLFLGRHTSGDGRPFRTVQNLLFHFQRLEDEQKQKSSVESTLVHKVSSQSTSFQAREKFIRNVSRSILVDLITSTSSNTAVASVSSATKNRYFSTKDEKGKSTQKPKNKIPHEKLSLSKPMDKDFERYLTGESSLSAEKLTSKKTSTADETLKKIYSLRYNPKSVSKEAYAKILAQRKQKSILKTSKNVNRALLGNLLICVAKFGAYASSGSSAMLAEFWHSVVDSGNQSLLLLGLRDSQNSADRKHPYGYGKSIYFWALVSALGSFFMGAGISMTNAIGDLMQPSFHEVTWQVWGVLAFSLSVDGYVFWKTINEVTRSKPKHLTYWQHFQRIRDPATLAILLEDGAACLGVLIALGGITATHLSGDPLYDGLAGVGISALLGGMGVALGRMNYRFLLGQAVDREITEDIAKILTNRDNIDAIGSVQSQWTGPDTFSYKAEVDFDGTSIAAELMTYRDYQNEFLKIKDTMDSELKILLALYAEDVMRAVEREVRTVEAMIRKKYPGAEYIELEPMSVDAHRLAIDDNFEAELRRVEGESLDRYLKSLRAEAATAAADMAAEAAKGEKQ